jgi:outer membrane protein
VLANSALAGGFDELGAGWTDIEAGGMVFVRPKYEGAKDYEVFAVPSIAPSGNSESRRVRFRGIDDLRFNLLDHYGSGFEAGPLIGYRFGRDEDDADRLEGLGDVDGGLIVGGYAGYRFGVVMPYVSYHHQVTGDDTGGIARLGIETRLPVGDRFDVVAVAGTTWADGDYMQSYFGVTQTQNANSAANLSVYDIDSGFKDVFLGVAASVPLGDRWSLKLAGRYAHLLGDAADSPIVEAESQWSGGVGLTYRFSTGR